MIRKASWWLAGVVGLAALPGLASGQAPRWQAEHDAGWNAYKEGRLDEAETRLRAAEKEARAFGENDPRLATTLDHLAWVLCAEGKANEGEPLAKRGLAIREKALGAEHPDVAKSLNTLACLADMQGKAAEAGPLYERCLAVSEKTQGPGSPNVAAVLDNLATVQHVLGKNAEAEAVLQAGPGHPREGAQRRGRSTSPRPSTTSGPSTSTRRSTPRPSRSSSGP